MTGSKDRIQCAAVVAFDDERGIGRDGTLPWRIPADMAFFKRLTLGKQPEKNAVVMGRVTWDSIPARFRPLVQRQNLVLTRGQPKLPASVQTASTLSDALASLADAAQIFVIGGASVYEAALQDRRCNQIFVTRVRGTHGCDRFFPEFEADFAHAETLDEGSDGGFNYRIERWERNAP